MSAVTSGRATAAGTDGFLRRRPIGLAPRALGRSGLLVSPIGFGCHRLEDTPEHRTALTLAIKCGCNFLDVAPGYTDGAAEAAVGQVLGELFAAGTEMREELIVATKVGNLVGTGLRREMEKAPRAGVAKVREDVWHCLEPAFIEEELTRSLERLRLDCVDVLQLHCPEFASRAPGVDMEEVYRRVGRAFAHLEKEVARGRIACYGVSAAFYPLRRSDPEHLLLDRLLALLPEGHHLWAVQCPLNFAEPQPLWSGQTARRADGSALDRDSGLEAPSLTALARAHGLAVLTNRPLDGLMGEMHGVMRFASEVPIGGEMQEEDLDALEAKLTALCGPALGDPEDPVTEELAAKTVKVLACLGDVDCVLVGMRQVEYVAGVVKMLKGRPPVDAKLALETVREANTSLQMWFCMAGQEPDHGTAKDWRLPPRDGDV